MGFRDTALWWFSRLMEERAIPFAKIPLNNAIKELYDNLVKEGFIDNETSIYHFHFLFGIPLSSEHRPFQPIRWKKGTLLCRYFITQIKDKSSKVDQIGCLFFKNKWGKRMNLPKEDKQRLETNCDYETLRNILKCFKNREF